ncbi:MAG: MFS transporter [Thermodesulfobacteriota bacterium]
MPENNSPPGPVSYRWLVFCLLAVGYLLVYFHRTSPAVVAVDLMNDLAADATLMGILGSAYFYPYALMQLPAGLLSDSWGPRRTITVFFLLAGAASIFFGLAPTAQWATLARVLVGLGVAMLFVPTMKVLTQWFKLTEFAMMTGILMAVGGAGVLIAAQPLAWLSGLLGWRGSFMAIGGVTLVLAALIWFLVRNRPEELGYPPVEAAVPTSPGAAPARAIGLGQGMKMVLARGSFWPLALWFFFTCGIFFSFGGLWGGPYLMQVYGLTRAEAGSILNMLAVAMIVGSPLLSFLSDRVFHSRKVLLVGCPALMVVLTAVLAFQPAGLSRPLLYVFCFLLSIGSSAIVVIAFASTKELFPVSIAGTAVGLVNFFPFFGGAVVQNVLGAVLNHLNPGGKEFTAQMYGQTFLILLGCAVAALIAGLLAEETFPGRAEKRRV